jgi:hypothetical protein
LAKNRSKPAGVITSIMRASPVPALRFVGRHHSMSAMLKSGGYVHR